MMACFTWTAIVFSPLSGFAIWEWCIVFCRRCAWRVFDAVGGTDTVGPNAVSALVEAEAVPVLAMLGICGNGCWGYTFSLQFDDFVTFKISDVPSQINWKISGNVMLVLCRKNMGYHHSFFPFGLTAIKQRYLSTTMALSTSRSRLLLYTTSFSTTQPPMLVALGMVLEAVRCKERSSCSSWKNCAIHARELRILAIIRITWNRTNAQCMGICMKLRCNFNYMIDRLFF